MAGLIFVFGSNLAGRHGKGAALWARKYRGAIYGQGEGLTGSSYAIPTKDSQLDNLPLVQIEAHVWKFLTFARAHLEMKFQLHRSAAAPGPLDHPGPVPQQEVGAAAASSSPQS
jgi:hypothetical protein